MNTDLPQHNERGHPHIYDWQDGPSCWCQADRPVFTIRQVGGWIDPCKYEIRKNGVFWHYAGSKWGARRMIRFELHPGPELIYDEGETE